MRVLTRRTNGLVELVGPKPYRPALHDYCARYRFRIIPWFRASFGDIRRLVVIEERALAVVLRSCWQPVDHVVPLLGTAAVGVAWVVSGNYKALVLLDSSSIAFEACYVQDCVQSVC